MRKLAEVAVAAGAVLALSSIATPAFASTVSTPSGNPIVVPADSSGNPRAITVTASGFQPDDSVFIEQCDGTPTTTFGWDPTVNCDLGTSPAPVVADSNGSVTFSALSAAHRFTPFKGTSPQGQFDCRAPQDPASAAGQPSFTNCQVRLSTNNSTVTGDQTFFTLSLPNPTVKVSCTTAGSLSFNKPLTNVAPTKPKTTKVKGSATLGTDAGTACDNSHQPSGSTKYPVTTGSIKFKGTLPTGRNCSDITIPNFSGLSLSIKWKGLKSGVTKPAGKSTVIVSETGITALPGGGYVLSGPVTAGNFAGSTVRTQIALSGGVTGESNTCKAGSLASVSFSAASPTVDVL